MLKVVQTGSMGQPSAADVPSGSLLDQVAREGARRMLTAALRAEADSYVDALVDQVDEDGHRLVVRNEHAEPRQALTAAGAIDVHAPRLVALVRAGATFECGKLIERAPTASADAA